MIQVLDKDTETRRSTVRVRWDKSSGETKIYNLGHDGLVELQLIKGGEVDIGQCYRNHLPPLGKSFGFIWFYLLRSH